MCATVDNSMPHSRSRSKFLDTDDNGDEIAPAVLSHGK